MRWLSEYMADVPCRKCGDGELDVNHNHVTKEWITAAVVCLECKAVDMVKINHAEMHKKAEIRRDQTRYMNRTKVLEAYARVYTKPPWTGMVLDASFGIALVEELGL